MRDRERQWDEEDNQRAHDDEEQPTCTCKVTVGKKQHRLGCPHNTQPQLDLRFEE